MTRINTNGNLVKKANENPKEEKVLDRINRMFKKLFMGFYPACGLEAIHPVNILNFFIREHSCKFAAKPFGFSAVSTA